jgi:hypothetical protein
LVRCVFTFQVGWVQRIFYYYYLSTFIVHYPRVSSKRFTFILTLLGILLG